MNYTQTYQSLLIEIDELKKHIESLIGSSDANEIDKDLALEKIRRIYDTLKSMGQVSLSHDEAKKTINTEESIHIAKKENTPELHEEPQVKDEESKEIIKEESNFTSIEDGRPEKHISVESKKDDLSKSIADFYAGNNNKSLNDNMALKNVMDLASKINAKPIDDIPRSIGLNDKFQYIKELFQGNSDLYNKTIKRLNEAENLNNAYTIITEEFNWDLDNELAQNLISLVHRKYAK